MNRSFFIFLLLFLYSVNESISRDITTLDGKTYKSIQIIDNNPVGIEIQSGSGVTLLKFKNLPENIRREFHYDPQKAKRYIERNKKRRIQRQKKAADRRRLKQKKEKIEARKRTAALRKKEEIAKLRKGKARLKPEALNAAIIEAFENYATLFRENNQDAKASELDAQTRKLRETWSKESSDSVFLGFDPSVVLKEYATELRNVDRKAEAKKTEALAESYSRRNYEAFLEAQKKYKKDQ